jgi:hypothetical protein
LEATSNPDIKKRFTNAAKKKNTDIALKIEGGIDKAKSILLSLTNFILLIPKNKKQIAVKDTYIKSSFNKSALITSLLKPALRKSSNEMMLIIQITKKYKEGSNKTLIRYLWH